MLISYNVRCDVTVVPLTLNKLVVFRKRLRKHGHGATLSDKTVEILKQRSVILEEGTCVDATIIEAPRGRKRSDPLFVPHGLEAKVDILSLNFDIIDNINSGRINFVYLY